jgi:hypothetical protein
MPDERDTYSIEPEPAGGAGSATPPPPPGPPGAEPGKAKIEAPALLEGFEEDADFTADPEVDRAVGLKKDIPPARLAPEPRAEKPDLVGKGWGQPLWWAIAGAALLIGAMVATGVNAPNRTVPRVLLAMYNILLHTGTGVVAVYLAAMLTETRIRSVESVAARMFVAVAALSLLFHLHLQIFPDKYETSAEELVVGAAAYVLVVAGAFSLWKRIPLAYVIGCHFALWLVVQLGLMLAALVAVSPPAPKVGG